MGRSPKKPPSHGGPQTPLPQRKSIFYLKQKPQGLKYGPERANLVQNTRNWVACKARGIFSSPFGQSKGMYHLYLALMRSPATSQPGKWHHHRNTVEKKDHMARWDARERDPQWSLFIFNKIFYVNNSITPQNQHLSLPGAARNLTNLH